MAAPFAIPPAAVKAIVLPLTAALVVIVPLLLVTVTGLLTRFQGDDGHLLLRLAEVDHALLLTIVVEHH